MLVIMYSITPIGIGGKIPTCGEFLVMWGALFLIVVLYIDRKIC